MTSTQQPNPVCKFATLPGLFGKDRAREVPPLGKQLVLEVGIANLH